MPLGYLVAVGLVAVGTAFALSPRPRKSALGPVSYYSGLLVNELPFVALYWLLLSTTLAFAQGEGDTLLGWVGFGLAAATTCGLAIVVGRAMQSGRVIHESLAAALGGGRQARAEGGAHMPRRRLPWARILVAPFWLRQRGVERVANISYGDAGERNLLDLYRRREGVQGCPVLVFIHGGGFTSGHKSREARPLLYRLAGEGWVCVSANYRLSPAATFPAFIVDVKKVIAWVREHGAEYGADPGIVFVAGSSAGGHLAALAALTWNVARFQPGFEGADTSVSGAICLYGYFGAVDEDPERPSSPAAYVGPGAPPFFVVHGDLDPLVPVEGAREFVEKLRAVSRAPVVYAELPGGHHTFDLFHSIRFEAVIEGVEAFAAWVRSAEGPWDAGSQGTV